MRIALFFEALFGIKIKRKQKTPTSNNVIKADFSTRRSLTPYSKERSNVATFKSKKEIFLRTLYDKFNAEDYEQNNFNHLIFNINGQRYLYSIIELDMMGVFKYNNR